MHSYGTDKGSDQSDMEILLAGTPDEAYTLLPFAGESIRMVCCVYCVFSVDACSDSY